MKRFIVGVLVVLITCSLLVFGAAPAFAASGETIRAGTDDGADIALRHYLPEPDAPYNNGMQPIVMMPGALANSNTYTIETSDGQDYGVSLPDTLPPWAEGDEYIQRDPMKLYSMAYYLYSMGYDVWLTHYRCQGRYPDTSYGGWATADIDHFGIYDVKASVEKVRELTGQKPVYVGHSMGCTMAYVYLQGAYHEPGWNFKVNSDPALVAERNSGDGAGAIKGFINLDGPLVPAINKVTEMPIVHPLMWFAVLPPIYFDLRLMTSLIPPGIGGAANWALWTLWQIKDLIPDGIDEIVAAMYSVNPENMEAMVLGFMASNGIDGAATHAIAQFMDGGFTGKLREYYRNGPFGRFRIIPPPLDGPENFYCYSDNMDKISVPSIFLADDTFDATNPAEIRACFDAKTGNPLDEFHSMPGTAHVDLVCGLKAPYETYPLIGAWLEKLCAN